MESGGTFKFTSKLFSTAELFFEGVNHLFWPRVCCNCQASILKSDQGLCADCWEQMRACIGGDYCRGCGSEVSLYAIVDGKCGGCDSSKQIYDGIARGGAYKDALREIILNLKFNDRPELSTHIGPIADAAMAGSGFINEIDMYVPVPLHWRRRLGRGFNQAMLLCKHIEGARKMIDINLVRVRYTHRQWNLDEPKRRKNVAGAFAVRKGHRYEGKTVCLVDDITTSGATLNECAKTLKAAGAAKVYGLVVAMAASRK